MTFLNLAAITRRIGEKIVLNNINFSQLQFEKLAIAGETGCGKSTLLKMIAGLVQPDSGEVIWNGERVKGPEERLVPGEPGVAYLSQHFELPKSLRVDQILMYASRLSDTQASKIYKVCRITHLLDRRTDQLSGGEKQRIALAHTLVTAPQLLLLDEPYSNLDIIHKNILKSVVNDISEKLKITIILVSHDPVDLLSWADTIMVMRDGQIVQKGLPEEIYEHPVDEYCAGLFGRFSRIDRKSAAKLFTGRKTADFNKKHTQFIRPERLRVTRSVERNAGTIMQRLYAGSFIELKVEIGGVELYVRTKSASLKVGDRVRVSVG